MAYPTYVVNGTPMQDPGGRWHEHEEMGVLPAHPGLRMGTFNLAGVGGEYRLPQAPITGQDFNLHMVVNAVDSTGNIPVSRAGRLAAIHENASELFRVLSIARMTQGSGAWITRHLGADKPTTEAFAVLEASVEPQYSPTLDHATYRFFFRILSGVWYGPGVEEKFAANTTRTHRIAVLAKCTAPIDHATVTLFGPFTWLQVTNQHGNGFKLTQTVADGQAVTVDTSKWQVSAPYTPGTPFEPIMLGAASSPNLHAVGQASGIALTLLPETGGAPVDVTGSGRATNTAVHITTREAYL